MKPSEALARHRTELRAVILGNRLSNPRIFGSVAVGCDADGSDLDLIVDAGGEVSLIDLARVQRELESIASVPVDLLTPEDLGPRIRSRVLAEAIPL